MHTYSYVLDLRWKSMLKTSPLWPLSPVYVYVHVCMYMYMYRCKCICMCAYMRVCKKELRLDDQCRLLNVCICIYVKTHRHTHTQTHTHTHTRTHTQTHTHTHTHTHYKYPHMKNVCLHYYISAYAYVGTQVYGEVQSTLIT